MDQPQVLSNVTQLTLNWINHLYFPAHIAMPAESMRLVVVLIIPIQISKTALIKQIWWTSGSWHSVEEWGYHTSVTAAMQSEHSITNGVHVHQMKKNSCSFRETSGQIWSYIGLRLVRPLVQEGFINKKWFDPGHQLNISVGGTVELFTQSVTYTNLPCHILENLKMMYFFDGK